MLDASAEGLRHLFGQILLELLSRKDRTRFFRCAKTMHRWGSSRFDAPFPESPRSEVGGPGTVPDGASGDAPQAAVPGLVATVSPAYAPGRSASAQPMQPQQHGPVFPARLTLTSAPAAPQMPGVGLGVEVVGGEAMEKFDPRRPSPYAHLAAWAAAREVTLALTPVMQEGAIGAASAAKAVAAWIPTMQQVLGAFSAYKAVEVVTDTASTAKEAVSTTIEVGSLHVEETMGVAATEFQNFIRAVSVAARVLCVAGMTFAAFRMLGGAGSCGLRASILRVARKFVWPSPYAQPATRSYTGAGSDVRAGERLRVGPEERAKYASWVRVAALQSKLATPPSQPMA